MAYSPADSTATAWHSIEPEKALELLQSDRQQGLTSEQVQERRAQYGSNELEEAAGRSSWVILLDQFKNIMLIMLIAVAIISAIIDIRSANADGTIPFPKDAISIFAIVILNGALGYIQESRAEKALAALKRLSSPRVRVVRDGRISEVDSKELVPGDVMLLEAGVQIAADGRLLEEANLQVREAALTGEAQAVDKSAKARLPEDAPLGDRINMVFQGTEVVQGRGTVEVTSTGMKTEIGRIAEMLQAVESEPTPLQQRMSQLGNVLVAGSLTLVALVVIGGVIRAGNFSPLEELLEVGLSMAVAVVPEGLPAVITVTLALGTQRMVRRNALIRKLPAVETLGSVTTICSDKTGTLTQNKMVVQAVHPPSGSMRVTGEGYVPEGEFFQNDQAVQAIDHPDLKALLIACALCNDSVLQKENGQWSILGDPTEGALLVVSAKAGIRGDQWANDLPRVGEFPFSSERKRMSVIVQTAGGKQQELKFLSDAPFLLFCKGSPELVLERCTQIQIGDRAEPITDAHRQQILDKNNELAGNGLRVLGFAYRSLPENPAEGSDEQYERDLVWLGLIDMFDAPRPEVRDAVARCKSACIRPVMITGDHQLTAQAIAQDLGISQAGDRVLTGRELEKFSPQDLQQQVNEVGIYARVAPEHKLRIVQALQHQGRVVAMTGDGVNDAPALKQADIGIAMGITGTDVSK
ncbi:MAG: HAD-IC family P-type ATPase, partial [Microcoleus sp. SIO2G3]|nr:HAD-IC family P-type ATPase [Microcoleus sp. SIO2G3]